MNTLQSISLLLTLCALAGWVNQKTVRWPPVLAMTVASILLAWILVTLGKYDWIPIEDVEHFIRSFDFADLVLYGLLGILLFAGSLFVNIEDLKAWHVAITSLATLGVLISASVVAGVIWVVAPYFGYPLGFSWCLLFGALIAPTDPIAALAVVRKAGAPKTMEIKLIGESLFNDSTSVMLFLIVLVIMTTGEVNGYVLIWEALIAPILGGSLGIAMGIIAGQAWIRADHRPTETLISLALATSAYGLALALHLSAPISVVAAGLTLGHMTRQKAGSQVARDHMRSFWKSIDEILNVGLFGLIGLELILIDIPLSIIGFGLLTWIIVLLARWAGVFGALLPFHRTGGLGRGTTRVMVWCGLRGGISLALALSLPQGPQASLLVALTFMVVALSASIQGLTLKKVIPRQVDMDKKHHSGPPSEPVL